MLIKMHKDHFKIVKTSLVDGSVVFPEWFGFEVKETDFYYIVSGSKAVLFELLYHFSKTYDIELL